MIFDYFFFKIYNAVLKSHPEAPRFMASMLLGACISVNIFVTEIMLCKLDILSSSMYHNKIIQWISTPIIIIIVFFIYKKSRIEAIKLKFSEDRFIRKKKELSIIFVLYLVFTFLTLVTTPFYKPGYF